MINTIYFLLCCLGISIVFMPFANWWGEDGVKGVVAIPALIFAGVFGGIFVAGVIFGIIGLLIQFFNI